MIPIKVILDDIANLKPFSNVAFKALQMINDESSNMKDIAELLKYDPAITIKILKIANSAFYSHSKQINDIFTALNYIGREQLSSIISLSASKEYFERYQGGYEDDEGEIWTHSLTVAILCEDLTEYFSGIDKAMIFTAGLLHDIGKIVLSKFVINDVSKIKSEMDKGVDFLEAEKNILGFTHADIGASILKEWKFPRDIVKTVKYHHQPLKVKSEFVKLLAIADYLAMLLGNVSKKDALAYKGYDDLIKECDISLDELEKILAKSSDKITKVLESIKESI